MKCGKGFVGSMHGVQWNPGGATSSPGLNEGVKTDLESLQRESDHEQLYRHMSLHPSNSLDTSRTEKLTCPKCMLATSSLFTLRVSQRTCFTFESSSREVEKRVCC